MLLAINRAARQVLILNDARMEFWLVVAKYMIKFSWEQASLGGVVGYHASLTH